MCGFVAFIQGSGQIDLGTARRAIETLTHRGPNAGGEWMEGNVILLHRRLSIIDLTTGDQPMRSGDGRHVLVFNGEIYNFQELRDQLTQKGVRLKTRSDTEVILEGYRQWGPNVVERLNGIFAFVIWDCLEQTVFAARDRLGIKPLCWAIQESNLILSSTVEAFEVLPGFQAIDPVAVRDLLTFDYIPSPRTIFRGVRKLEPGSQFKWRIGEKEPNISRYWSPPKKNEIVLPPSSGELEGLLDLAVARQMISDVPIGAFLSGGIDSSLLVAFMARHSSQPVRTFSCAFADTQINESPIAELVSKRFGTDHLVLQSEDIDEQKLLEILGRLDEPFADPAVIPTYALSVLTATHVRVALSGDGADEIFGGYPKYLQGTQSRSILSFGHQLDGLLRAMSWRPQGLSSFYWRTLSSPALLSWSCSRFGDFPVFPKDLRQVIATPYHECAEVNQFFMPWKQRASRYQDSLEADFLMRTDLETYLSENCLVKTDRASMLASLEVRVPYLDEMVLERLVPLSAEYKIVNGELKSLLVSLARKILPREVWDRPKQGFHVPLDNWLAGKWRVAVENALDWGESNFSMFNYPYLRRLHRLNLRHRTFGRFLWNPFVILVWMRKRSFIL
ncbi:MAG: asparagine synthase (glutamine-hydrolyzing) [Nitrospira sp.]|nr:asparagine synthase (glutamine-hydrolyzing) [Nitrospira sp.]